MPKFDGTGPRGMGSRTGKGFGTCGFGMMCRHCGRGRGLGSGRGLGRFFGWNQPQSKEEKLEALSDYKKALEEELEDVKKKKLN